MRYTGRPQPRQARVRAAWQGQLAAAGQTPGLGPTLVRRRHELFPRFAFYYTQLRALPRQVRRALQRQWRRPLAGVALVLALGQAPAQAAMLTVGGACTLVDAITAANTDTATGGCPAGSGADTLVLPVGSTQTLTEVNNATYDPTGLPVISSAITIAGQGSTIARDPEAPAFRLFAVSSTGDLTLQETTVSGGFESPSEGGGIANFGGTLTITNSTISGNRAGGFGDTGAGGGIANSGTLIVTNSTISGNVAETVRGGGDGGGIANSGTLIVTNSTISGNVAETVRGGGDGGGIANSGTLIVTNSTISGNRTGGGNGGFGGGIANSGTLTVTNSTISGNAAESSFFGGGGGGGGVDNSGTLTLVRTLVSGNNAPNGPEIYGASGTIIADNHNLFGVNGTAGAIGFSPGTTDLVPPVGVLLPDILTPTLAFNGGPTQTHALVPGSPAIDAGGPVCTDATGAPLLTDQRGRPRVVDGNGDGTAACDIGAFEFFPLVNAFVTLDPALATLFAPTPVPGGPAGTFTITATFTNTSATALRFPFFTVTELTGGNLVLNADAGVQGVGATVTPAVGDQVLAPGETVAVDFVIGLQAQEPFRFFVDLFGEPHSPEFSGGEVQAHTDSLPK